MTWILWVSGCKANEIKILSKTETDKIFSKV